MQELYQRILFTLFMIVIFKLGTHIPVPGIDSSALEIFASDSSGGVLSMLNTFSGGALMRGSIFALYLGPYITASIVVQMTTYIYDYMKELKETQEGREKISQYSRYLSIVLAITQSYGMAILLESQGQGIVINPGYFFRFICVVNMTIGTMILVWISEQITMYGFGNGSSIVILVGIISGLPNGLLYFFDLFRKNLININQFLIIIIVCIALLLITILCETAARKVNVQYPRHMQGRNTGMNNNSYIPLKINVSGVIPPILAMTLMQMPITLISNAPSLSWLAAYVYPGSISYIMLYMILLISFAFLHSDMVFNPKDVSNRLQMSSGYVVGVRPGRSTELFFEDILFKLSGLACIYLIVLCIVPQLVGMQLGVSMAFGGTTMLIVVNVIIDTIGKFQSYGIEQKYKRIRVKY
ncbi:MAG: preprotein translocase subunit SecY [Pseudomonadota bacterium]